MANALYNTAKEAFLSGELDLTQGNVKVLLVRNNYVVDLNSDSFVSDIPSAYVAARSTILNNVTVTLGTFDASNETVDEYGNSGFSYLIIYVDTGDDFTSRLVAYIDTATGLPVESTSANVSIILNWSNEASKIFTL